MKTINNHTLGFIFIALGAACAGDKATVNGPTDPPPVITPPVVGPPLTPSVETPPPISGGTLAVLRDGRTAVASDPDRDRIYVVSLAQKTIIATVTLQKGDEPGRIAEDGNRRVHVSLRSGGAVVTLDAQTGALLTRRALCSAPRGIAYDAAKDLIHVACAGGELVSISPLSDTPARVVDLDRDLRDVMIRGDKLFVTTFRSAQLLVVGADGKTVERLNAPAAASAFANFRKQNFNQPSMASPSVAWRMVEGPAGQPVMMHQRGVDDVLGTEPGAYSTFSCAGIVEGAVTEFEPDAVEAAARVHSGRAMAGAVLPVDLAISPGGKQMVVVAAGNQIGSQLQFYAMNEVSDGNASSGTGGSSGSGGAAGGSGVAIDVGPGGQPCLQPSPVPIDGDDNGTTDGETDGLPEPTEYRAPNGELIAVAFDRKGNILVQSRQPAMLQILTQRADPIILSSTSKANAGHKIFHGATTGLVACASCHPEGGEDNRIWNFDTGGQRRTQSLRGGVMDTAPFHWNGELASLGHLMTNVFQGRMQGDPVTTLKTEVLKGWIESIPAIRVSARADGPRDPQAAVRGKGLFFSDATRCATCHGGADFTNNLNYDVGTGGFFQVPQLHGMALRGPYMHNGCAKTLKDRFSVACGGGDQHGTTSMLSPEQIDDLVAYLETL